MLLSLLATDDTSIGSTTLHPALKTIVGQKCKTRIHRRIQVKTWQVPGAAVTTGPGAAVVAGAAVVVAAVSGWEKLLCITLVNKGIVSFPYLEQGRRHHSIPRRRLQRHGRRWRQSVLSTREWCLHRWWYSRSERLP